MKELEHRTKVYHELYVEQKHNEDLASIMGLFGSVFRFFADLSLLNQRLCKYLIETQRKITALDDQTDLIEKHRKEMEELKPYIAKFKIWFDAEKEESEKTKRQGRTSGPYV